MQRDNMPVAVNDVVTLKIAKLVNGGDGLGRFDDLAVFVPRTAPQDIVKVRIVSRKKHFVRAELLDIITPSPQRISSPCPFFLSGCGGCQWLHLAYDAQLAIKTSLVMESIRHTLKNELVNISTILPMDNPVHYRNKATAKCSVTKSGELKLGFFAGRSHRVVDVFARAGGTCLVQSQSNNNFLSGCMRALRDHLDWLRQRKVTSIAVRSVYPGDSNRSVQISTDLPEFIFTGRKKMLELLADPVRISCCGRDFQVSGPSFFQTNTRQAEILLRVVEKFLQCDPPSGKILVDLFSGVGLFSLTFADSFDHVYGIESSLSAVSDARCNSESQGVDNVSWLAGRAEDVFASLSAGLSELDTVIIDPPREGCDRQLLMQLVSSSTQKIIYVSCDLATLCRDLQYLVAGGFGLAAVQPVDMFPHTAHIECVALLVRNAF